MTQFTDPGESTALHTEASFAFSPKLDPAELAETEPDEFDDAEFRPRQRSRVDWLTVVLIGLIVWCGGFLAGVLAARSFGGLLG